MKNKNKFSLFHSILWGLLLLSSSVLADTHKNAAIIKATQQAMEKFQVPGVAIAIVKDNQVVMSQGFGVTNIETKQPVNADTLFGIASNTKAMTASILASLVDEGKLTWQTKVKDIIPTFELYDPFVTAEFTVRDLLSHNSGLGLGAGDLMIWPETDLSVDDIIKRLRYLKPVSSFRSEFAYDNLMYIVAGKIIETLTGKPWHEVIQQRIFQPLGMKNTRANYSSIPSDNHNVASAHVPLNGQLQVVGGNFLEKFSSAGSVASSVNDMSRWMLLQLNRGEFQSENQKPYRLFSTEQSEQLWQPNTLIPVGYSARINDKMHFNSYALGWFVSDFHGVEIVHHSGGILGMVSKVVLVPEANLGLVILTNQQSGYAFNALYREILTQYLSLPERDWVSYYYDKYQQRLANEHSRLATITAAANKNSQPSLALADYAGEYRDNWYGPIHLTLAQGKLRIQFGHTPALVGTLEHYQYNTFIVRWDDRTLEADAFINFQLSVDGKVESATMKAVSSLTDFSFDFHDLFLQKQSM
jgi:CubicO group peptidase (beta-lactamase class C family)